MKYEVELLPAAQRDIRKLPADVQERLWPHLRAIAANPRPANAIKLQGTRNGYRLRVGHYRVLYEIQDKRLLFTVTRAAHRRDVYE